MGHYIPGAFKKKNLVLENYDFPEDDIDFSDEDNNTPDPIKNDDPIEEIVPEIIVNPNWSIKKSKPIIDVIKVAEVVENEKWKKFKGTSEVKEIEAPKNDIKVVKYQKMGIYARRKKYLDFVREDWHTLWDIYNELLMYDIKFLDRLRIRDDNSGFLEMSQVVFNHLY